jgi:ATP-binding cassette subfamily B protein
MNRIIDLAWPASRLGEGMEGLARRSGLAIGQVETPIPSESAIADDARLGRWIEEAAAWLGMEAEPVESPYTQIEQLLRNAAPALLRLPGKEEGFILLLKGKGKSRVLLAPDLVEHRVELEELRTLLCQELEAPLKADLEKMLEQTGVGGRQRSAAMQAILRERLSHKRIGGCWMLRPAPGANFFHHLRQIHLSRHALLLAGAHLLQYLLWIVAWWLVGIGALQGRFDPGWLLAWGLILLTIVPLRMLEVRLQGTISIGAGAILKQRLLNGALNLDPEEIKHQGSGQLLGEVIESQSVETLALGGGFQGAMSIIELILAAIVLAAGVEGILHLLLLLVWTAAGIFIGLRYYRLRLGWTRNRLDITHTIVERMIGHRTRLAQERPEAWHRGEDQEAEHYLEESKKMDRVAALLETVVPRGWLILGLIGLAPAFISQNAPGSIAVTIGGILLGYGAFGKLVGGIVNLSSAAIAWKQIAPLFNAASRGIAASPIALHSAVAGSPDTNGSAQTILKARELVFRYREHGAVVLHGCTLDLHRGDRILMEGPSGGGKSTFASLLVGLRQPQSGLLLLHGLDRRTVGGGEWRRHVVAAPQFHENHVLMGTFAFNLLMGRRWPPQEEDMVEAEKICRELGLGDLLERMPAGLLQNIGETGWQLSHGERSRLYIARALLQHAEVIVLDESFGALDPRTLQQALRCVFDRAPTLLVIAHP